ncbi:hypothetical protein [Nostoc sp.]|uniref:hypothetical protein n=1 Tax=Nostoc sp. TaxID=1180 RepID=UPI002FF536A5
MSIGQNLTQKQKQDDYSSSRTRSNSAGSDDHHPNDSPVQSTFFPLSEWQSIAVFARDESGLIVGGVLGEIGCD